MAAAATVTTALVPMSASAAPEQKPESRTVDLQLLAVNDFHGNLEAPSGSGGRIVVGTNPDGTPRTVDAGGAEYLATHLANLRAGHPNSLTVAAGDLIGATPLLSAAFHDEPTVESLGTMGLDVTSVGNHEFDEGQAELLRMADGGCHPVDGCFDEDGWSGADFPYLAANVVKESTGDTLLPPTWVKKVDGVKVGFIGMTLEGTPDIVTQSGIEGLEFRDEVETANALVPALQRKGVQAIVVLLHEGGIQPGLYDECTGISGPVVGIAENLDPAIDVMVTGHTHQGYNCTIDDPAGDPRLVTSASSFGRLVTEIDLTLDHRTNDVVRPSATATNHIVTRDVAKDPAQTQLIAKWRELLGPIASQPVGTITADINRVPDASGENPLGDLIADAQLADTAPADRGGAVAAFMNPGGVRADLSFAPDGVVTFEEAFSVQPFTNLLVTMTLTGAQLDTMLEQQFGNPDPAQNRILLPSDNVHYTWSASAPKGSKVSELTFGGTPVDPSASYRVTVNSFLADGGDGFSVLREGTDRLVGATDLDAFTAYLSANSPAAPPATDRIDMTP
ncbi:MAG: bifunctional metallophosphatase/5'-nucleotidase [Actinomycetes bacterium]